MVGRAGSPGCSLCPSLSDNQSSRGLLPPPVSIKKKPFQIIRLVQPRIHSLALFSFPLTTHLSICNFFSHWMPLHSLQMKTTLRNTTANNWEQRAGCHCVVQSPDSRPDHGLGADRGASKDGGQARTKPRTHARTHGRRGLQVLVQGATPTGRSPCARVHELVLPAFHHAFMRAAAVAD
jgi:hypothetical protein